MEMFFDPAMHIIVGFRFQIDMNSNYLIETFRYVRCGLCVCKRSFGLTSKLIVNFHYATQLQESSVKYKLSLISDPIIKL